MLLGRDRRGAATRASLRALTEPRGRAPAFRPFGSRPLTQNHTRRAQLAGTILIFVDLDLVVAMGVVVVARARCMCVRSAERNAFAWCVRIVSA